VALIARGTESLQGAQEEIEREGGKALTVSADVADAKSIFEAADVVAKQWGWDQRLDQQRNVTTFSPFCRALSR
jgi:NADP-dependent 3-hydroxy acid dehydrogenase YdfG